MKDSPIIEEKAYNLKCDKIEVNATGLWMYITAGYESEPDKKSSKISMESLRRPERCDLKEEHDLPKQIDQMEELILKFFTGSNKTLINEVESLEEKRKRRGRCIRSSTNFRLVYQLPKLALGELMKGGIPLSRDYHMQQRDKKINDEILTYLLINPHGIQDYNHPWKTMSTCAFEKLKSLNKPDPVQDIKNLSLNSENQDTKFHIPVEIINTHLSKFKETCLYTSDGEYYSYSKNRLDHYIEALSKPKTDQLIQYYDNNCKVQAEYHDHQGQFIASLRRDFQEYLNADTKGQWKGVSSLAYYVHRELDIYNKILERFDLIPDKEKYLKCFDKYSRFSLIFFNSDYDKGHY